MRFVYFRTYILILILLHWKTNYINLLFRANIRKRTCVIVQGYDDQSRIQKTQKKITGEWLTIPKCKINILRFYIVEVPILAVGQSKSSKRFEISIQFHVQRYVTWQKSWKKSNGTLIRYRGGRYDPSAPWSHDQDWFFLTDYLSL